MNIYDIDIELENNNIDIDITDEENIEFEVNATDKSGTSNYNYLYNKPKINSVELIGNKSSDELNLQEKGNYANSKVTNIEIDNLF